MSQRQLFGSLCLLLGFALVVGSYIHDRTVTQHLNHQLPFQVSPSPGYFSNEMSQYFFKVPYKEYDKGSHMLEMGQVGPGCTSPAAIKDQTFADNLSTKTNIKVDGHKAVQIIREDMPWEHTYRGFHDYGTTPVITMNVYFTYSCRLYRIGLTAPLTEKVQAHQEFDSILASAQFEGIF